MEKYINDLTNNKSTAEITLAGLELGPIRCAILAKAMGNNATLKELHLNRKGIGDNEGDDLFKYLL